MKRSLAVVMSGIVVAALSAVADAQSACPPEVAQAKELLSQRVVATSHDVQAPRSLAGARGAGIQSPRGVVGERPDQSDRDLQAPRGQDVQAPRGQDVQSPRGVVRERPDQSDRDLQAPRGQDVQAPRGQDVQPPRGKDVQSPRAAGAAKPAGISRALTLVKEAEAACQTGDAKTAKSKAEAAIAILR
jgi:hypothetical protein